MNETIFSKIIVGEIPSYRVYEDEDVFAFLDLFPATPGHTLVIPKIAVESVLDASPELMEKTFVAAGKLAQHIVKELDADGCNILSNAGAIAGQEVMHWHVHIIPRYLNDGIGPEFNLKHAYEPNESKEAFLEKIQHKIQIDNL